MDIRIARTDRAIEKAFMELRAKNPLEKIKIKDLCALACINKSTFYAHYEDIYALSSGLETKVICNILACVTDFGPNRPLDHTEELTQGLFRAFVQNQRAVNILFSGSRQGVFANSIEQGRTIVGFWMPNKAWPNCNVNDPSARVLANNGASGV